MTTDLKLYITPAVRRKLADADHNVTEDEIRQAFASRDGKLLIDDREQHRTTPATRWFVAETDYGRRLKVCFVYDGGVIEIKTAYTASETIFRIYKKHAY